MVDDQTVFLQDSSTAFVTFNLTGMPTGAYSVQGTQAAGGTSQLAQGLTVVAAMPANLQYFLSTPSATLPNSQGNVTINYVNEGNTDAMVPLLSLSADNAMVRLPDQAGFSSSSVEFLGMSSTGPGGILRPGESGQIQIPFQAPATAGETIGLQLEVADDTQTIDWASQESALRPTNIAPDAWQAIFGNLVANLGSTVASYQQVLANDAIYLSQFGEYIDDPSILFNFEVTKAADGYSGVTLASNTDASYPSPGLQLVFQRTFGSSIADRYLLGPLGRGWTDNWQIAATTDSQGNVIIQNGGQSNYFAIQPNGSFLANTGNFSALSLVNGAYHLQQPDGTLIVFNADGTLNYEQDNNGNRITASYSGGRLTSLTNSEGKSLTIAYNSQGLISSVTDPAGQVSSYTYDPTGQYLLTYTDAIGATDYSYVTGQSPAQNNSLASITLPGNTSMFFSYDSQGRLTDQHMGGGANDLKYTYLNPGGYTITDGNGKTSTILFDYQGNTTETITALGEVVHYTYNDAGEVIGLTGPQGASYSYSYDSQGNLIQSVDALGRQITYTFNSTNRLTGYTDPNGNATTYQPDSNGNLQSITYANGTSEQVSYNPLGEATQFVNANGNAIGYTYNDLGFVTKETFANGASYTYTYDSLGNLTSATDAQGNITTFKYDPSTENLVEVDYPSGDWLKFQYDSAGNRSQSTDQTGFTIDYTYNPLGQLVELTDGSGNLIVKYTYDNAGNLVRKDMGNGTATIYTYDGDNDILSIVNDSPSGAVNSFDDYTYDPWGRALTDVSQNGTWTYTYDLDGELTNAVFVSSNTAVLPNQNIQYVYDANGNRTSQTVNGVTTTYAVNSVNEYTNSTTNGAVTTYQYDDDGNLLSTTDASGTTSYTYNELNELTGVSSAALSATYAYDPLGSQVAQTINGVTTNFQVDPTGISSVVAAYDGSGNLETHYVYGLGLTSQVSADNDSGYYDFNANGSTVGITGSSGSYLNQYAYQPFGETTTIAASLSNPFTYVGQAGVTTDPTNLFFMRNRTYDPNLGQFLTVDPIGIYGGINTRVYTGNDPVMYSDPIGLCKTVTVYIWREGPGSFKHAAIDVDGTLLDKATSSGDPFKVLFGLAPGTTNWDDGGVPPTIAYSFNVDDNTAGQMLNQISFDQGDPYFNLLVDNCTEAVTSVLNAGNKGPFNPLTGCAALLARSVAREEYRTVAIARLPSSESRSDSPFQEKRKGNSDPRYRGTRPQQHHWPCRLRRPELCDPRPGAALPDRFRERPDSRPAQQVIVTQQLDGNLNWQSFRLGNFGFGGNIYIVPANSAFFQTQIDLTQQDGFYVDVTGTIDESTGIATWTFTTIDPATGLIPLDPTLGFLPPDIDNGIGEGFVSYTIAAKQSDPTGTVIDAQATVTFYTQPPLNTPSIFNTIDAGTGLTSTVAALPAFQASTSIPVSWSGVDGSTGSAISGFTIYVSDNGGAFAPWLTDTLLTQATYMGQAGHTYAFYSIATDNAGNEQATPSSAQASTTIDLAPSFTSANATAFVVGTMGSFTLTANGAPTPTFTESGALPSGVSFANGILSGIPGSGTTGTYTLTFTAHNGIGADATQSFTLTIDQVSAITSANSTTFAVGGAGSFTVTDSGFPAPTLTESGALPSGVVFTNGKFSGTPAAGTTGTYDLTITAHNGVGADATQSFTLNVVVGGGISGTVFHDFNANGARHWGFGIAQRDCVPRYQQQRRARSGRTHDDHQCQRRL